MADTRISALLMKTCEGALGKPRRTNTPQTSTQGPIPPDVSEKTATEKLALSEKQALKCFKLYQHTDRVSRASVKQAGSFEPFVLPDGNVLRAKKAFVPQVPVQQAQTANVPLADAQAQMQQFVQGQPMMAGQGVQHTGLDRPSDTRAATIPGLTGNAGMNVIDMRGGLDPSGQVVDGNHGSGVAKGFKMAGAGESGRSDGGSTYPPLSNGLNKQDDTAGIAYPPLSSDSLRAVLFKAANRRSIENGSPDGATSTASSPFCPKVNLETPQQIPQSKCSGIRPNSVRSVLDEDFTPYTAPRPISASLDFSELSTWASQWLKKAEEGRQAAAGFPGRAVNRNHWDARLARLQQRRDPAKISQQPVDVAAKQASLGSMAASAIGGAVGGSGALRNAANTAADAVKFHAPRIRPFDSAVGTGLGAAGGLGLAAIRDAMSDDEEEDNHRYLTHGLGGAALGFGAANLVGDRTRRYLANNIAPYGYDGSLADNRDVHQAATESGIQPADSKNVAHTDFVRPRSLQHVWETAVKDRPSQATQDFLRHKKGPALTELSADARQELLRRHTGLPVRPEDAVFRSTGNRWFQPSIARDGNVVSGGIPGNYEHVEFSPAAIDKYRHKGLRKYLDKTREHLTTPREIPEQVEQTVYPQVDKPGWFGRMDQGPADQPETKQVATGKMVPNPARENLQPDPFGSLFARHGLQIDPEKNTARVYDHWDFGLQPLEKALAKQYLADAVTGGGDLSETIPYNVRRDWERKQVADWFGGAKKDQQDPTKKEHLAGLVKRWILNNVVGDGGVVFDQEFDLSDPVDAKPLYFNPRQTDVGLQYLPGAESRY